MKLLWGRAHQSSFIYSAWDLPPNDTAPSTIFRVDTAWPLPRIGRPLLQCFGVPGNAVHLGEATGNRTDLYFLVDFDQQVAQSFEVGEPFSADIYHAYRSGHLNTVDPIQPARTRVPIVKADDDVDGYDI